MIGQRQVATQELVPMIGSSPVMKALKGQVHRVARADTRVLITGETGTGKELVVRELHAQSMRSRFPLANINCGGVEESVLMSELFGHRRGSFTGAGEDRQGKLVFANGGTVLLDEVEEMGARMQAALLRFLESGEVQPVGSDKTETIDVRVIAATNRDLARMVAEGAFRQDLYFRLAVVPIHVPSLRERCADIPELVQHFLGRFCHNGHRTEVRAISPEAVQVLGQYNWPGNVRELENLIEQMVVTVTSNTIGVGDLPFAIRSPLRTSALWSGRDRRRNVADELYGRMVTKGESFWKVVYPLYMKRELTREDVRRLVRTGLQETRGNYKLVTRLFNVPADQYKKLLNFLRKHDCQVSFHEYR